MESIFNDISFFLSFCRHEAWLPQAWLRQITLKF